MKAGITDTCGVLWLHGLPGLFGALCATWIGSKIYYASKYTPNSVGYGNYDTLIKAPYVASNTYAVLGGTSKATWSATGVMLDSAAWNPLYFDIWTYASVFPQTIAKYYTPILTNVGEAAVSKKV